MEIKEEVIIPAVPAKTTQKKIGVKCDLCKKFYRGADSYHDTDWPTDCSYDVETTGVYYESGSAYPEGRFTETTVFHICPDCFTERLIPWLKEQGAEPTVGD